MHTGDDIEIPTPDLTDRPLDRGQATTEYALVMDWVHTMGYPLTEAYWTRTTIGGVEQWVLIQPFERRLLTYVPNNQAGWQVEQGNVGRHYYRWRYGIDP